MPIYRADEVVEVVEGRASVLNVGPPFNGKTQSLWTLVQFLKDNDLGPLWHIDLDLKADSLIQILKEKELLDWYVLIRLASQAKLRGGARKVEDAKKPWEDFQYEFNKFDDQIDAKTGEWKPGFQCGAMCFDSMTEYNDMVKQYVVGTLGHDLGEKGGGDSRNDYTKVMNKLMMTVKASKTFPCIVVWNAHDMITKSEVDGKIVLLPNVSGKDTLAPTLSREFTTVLFSTTQTNKEKQEEFVWQVRPGGWVRSAGYPTADRNIPMFIPQDYRKILIKR